MDYYGYKVKGALLDERGPFELVTPGRVLSEMRSIDTDTGSLSRDIQASDVSADFKSSFGLFATEWRAFFDDYTGSPLAWAGRTQNAVIRKVDEYRRAIDAWRANFEKLGGQLSSPARPKATKKFPWGWAAGVLGVAGLVWFAFKRGDE